MVRIDGRPLEPQSEFSNPFAENTPELGVEGFEGGHTSIIGVVQIRERLSSEGLDGTRSRE